MAKPTGSFSFGKAYRQFKENNGKKLMDWLKEEDVAVPAIAGNINQGDDGSNEDPPSGGGDTAYDDAQRQLEKQITDLEKKIKGMPEGPEKEELKKQLALSLMIYEQRYGTFRSSIG